PAMDPTYPLIPVLNILTAALVLYTLLSISLRGTWNSGVVMLGSWVFIRTSIRGTEAIVWSNNFENKAPVWCDISTHVVIAASFAGIPACSLIISRRLHHVICSYALNSASDIRRKSFLFDIALGIGLPLCLMALFPVVQDVRFQVVEDMGCSISMAAAIFTLLAFQSWGVILPLISIILYFPTIIRELYVHHKQMNSVLSSMGVLDRTRYMRLVAIACMDMLMTLPIGTITLAEALHQDSQLPFWPPWPTILANNPPRLIPEMAWRSMFWSRFTTYFSQTSVVALGLVFFLLFGATRDALSAYYCAFSRIKESLRSSQQTVHVVRVELSLVSSQGHTATDPECVRS
ncbi:GPCR fungal pheromone mating factor, partial [Vararia minispora EC-137]